MTPDEIKHHIRAAGLKAILYDEAAMSALTKMFKAAEVSVREECARKCEALLIAGNGKSEYIQGHDNALTKAAFEIRLGGVK